MADAPARFKDLCLDANDHHALADWWCAAIGYVRRDSLADAETPEEDEPRPHDSPTPRATSSASSPRSERPRAGPGGHPDGRPVPEPPRAAPRADLRRPPGPG